MSSAGFSTLEKELHLSSSMFTIFLKPWLLTVFSRQPIPGRFAMRLHWWFQCLCELDGYAHALFSKHAYFSKRLSWCWMIHVSNHSSVFLGLALIILRLVMCGGNLRITPAVKEVKESVIVARWWRWDVNCPSSPVQSVQLVKVVVMRLIYGRSRSQVISFVCYTSRTIKKDL